MRLRELCHRAGTPEYWIVDARQDPIRFVVLLNVPAARRALHGRP